VSAKLRRGTQIGLGLALLVAAMFGAVESSVGIPEPGVIAENPGGVVDQVDPGGPIWRDGIRAGDQVLDLGDGPGGWRLITSNAGVVREGFASSHLDVLRSHIPWSIMGLLLAALTAFLAYRGHAVTALVMPIAFAVAVQPIFFAGSYVGEILAGILVFAGGALAVAAFARTRRVVAIPIVLGIGCALGWAASILALQAIFPVFDAARAPAVAGLGISGFLAIADRSRIRAALVGEGGPAYVDLLYLGVALALGAAALLGRAPVEVVLVVGLLSIAVYPFWRRATLSLFDRLVVDQMRRDALTRVIEDERGRLAREIHDAPLQELSGVIHRLDAVAGAEDVADSLRLVAAHLRNVATTLHPPVLQDLGLAPAIEDLRDQLANTYLSLTILAEVDDLTNGLRPPSDVELAAYRIVQEATANALAHGNAQLITVRGSVARQAIELAVIDDGGGFGDEAARSARRSGHFGLDSMRERARAVGGTTEIDKLPDGVAIRFHWEAKP
jgi:signal transduction histidine kinase